MLRGLGLLPALLMAGFSSQAAEPVSKAPPYAAEDFVRASDVVAMKLSPTGEYLAVTHRLPSKKFGLFVLKLPERKTVGVLQFDRKDSVGEMMWASPTRLVAHIAWQDEDGDSMPARTGELFAMNFDGSAKRYLTGGRNNNGPAWARTEASRGSAEPVRTLPKDPGGLLVMVHTGYHEVLNGNVAVGINDSYGALYRLDVLDGSLRKLLSAPIRSASSYLADSEGRPRLVWGYGDGSADPRYFWKDEQHDWTELKLKGIDVDPLRAREDGSSVFLSLEKDAATRCLIEVPIPLGGPEAIKELICGPLEKVKTFFFDREGVPYGYRGRESDPIYLIGDRKPDITAGVLASLQAEFEDQSVSVVSQSQDSKRIVFFVYGDRYPGEYLLYDADTKEASYLGSRREWLEPARLAEMKVIRYQARDGLPIEGFLTLPPGREPKKLPLVVLPHGGPIGVWDVRAWDAEAQFLASRGYGVLQVNYRGSGGYGQDFLEKGHGEWAGKIIDDITDGTRSAIEAGYADAQRICIFGASYGGYAAMMSLVREPDLYRCGISMAGVYDLNALFQESDATLLQSGRLFWQKSIAQTPEERAKLSPISYLDRLKAPVFIVHGGMDIRTPESQAKRFRKALDARELPYEWLFEEEEGHGFFNEKRAANFLRRLEAFLGKYNPP